MCIRDSLYVVTTSEKFYPAKAGIVPIEEQDPFEIWKEAPPGVCVENYYFEYVPLDLITGVIDEDGILNKESILKKLEEMPVSSLLKIPE